MTGSNEQTGGQQFGADALYPDRWDGGRDTTEAVACLNTSSRPADTSSISTSAAACLNSSSRPADQHQHELDDNDRCKHCGEDFSTHLALKGAGLL